MYESLKKWIDVPVSIKPFVRRTGTGDKEFGELIDTKCYPVAEHKIVRTSASVEIVSDTQLYFNGNEQVAKLDVIMFEGEEHPVQHISTFYRQGKPDLKVVYI